MFTVFLFYVYSVFDHQSGPLFRALISRGTYCNESTFSRVESDSCACLESSLESKPTGQDSSHVRSSPNPSPMEREFPSSRPSSIMHLPVMKLFNILSKHNV